MAQSHLRATLSGNQTIKETQGPKEGNQFHK